MISERKFIEISNNKMSYYTIGEGKPIIFLHGTNSDGKTSFEKHSKLFNNNKLIIVDYGGCGESTFPQENEMDFFSRGIKKIIKELDYKKVDIIGVSLGSIVALATASKYPEIIEKIVLTAPWNDIEDSRHKLMFNTWLELEKENSYLANCFGISHVLSSEFISRFSFDQLEEITNKKNSKNIIDRIKLGLKINVKKYTEKIQSDTLIIGLTNDTLIPLYQVEKVHKDIENSKYIKIKSGHAVQIENPIDWANSINNFLDYKNKKKEMKYNVI